MLARALPFALLAAAANAQFLPNLEISEILLRPPAGDHCRIEVIAANVPFSTAGYHLVIGANGFPLPAASIAPYQPFVVHLGVNGASSGSDLFLPGAPALPLSGSVALFRSSLINDPTQFLDYVGWGGATGPQAAMAVQAGRWSATSDSCAVPALVGSTLANRRITRSTGNLVGPLAWYDDRTPTFGSENDPAMTWAFGTGCVTSNPPLFGVLSSIDPGPWLGEPATLFVSSVTSFAVLALGTTPTPPIDLAPIGMPNCFAHLQVDATVLLTAGPPNTAFVYTVPVDPLFVGFEFFAQAFVLDPLAGNPIGAQVTGAVKAHVGSR